MTDNLPAHSHLGASSSERWMACPGSIKLSHGIERQSSSYAAEGSAAHQLADLALTNPDADMPKAITIDGMTFDVDDEMIEAVQVYIDAIKERTAPGDEVESEVKFHLKDLHKDLFGTADCTIYSPKTKKLVVIDFKYGKGVPVEAEGNPQLLYYGYGAATRKANRGVGEVEIVVVQPRCPHPQGPVRSWHTDVVQLLDHSQDLVDAVKRTEDPKAELHAGDWCKFCPAAAICPERRQSVLDTIKADFSDDGTLHLPEPTRLDVETRRKVFAIREEIKDWLKRLDEFEHHEAEAGRCLPGWKLVNKRATRKWIGDRETVALTLETKWDLPRDELMTEPELKSPAQVEKLLPAKKRAELKPLYESVSSGRVLAPESDPRPAAKSEAAEEFAA